MDVAVDYCGAPDAAISLQHADCNGHIVQRTETFAVIREGVMKAASQMRGHAIIERGRGSHARAADHQPERVGQLRRPWQLHRGRFLGGECVAANLG